MINIFLFFIYTKLIICRDLTFDINLSSIEIYTENYSTSWLISYNNSIITLSKDDILIIGGETSTNTIKVQGNNNLYQSEINIILDHLFIQLNNSNEHPKYPFYFEGITSTNIFISINSGTIISTPTSAFYISPNCENCTLNINGASNNVVLTVTPQSSSSETFIINSSSHISLRNLQISSFLNNGQKKAKKLTLPASYPIFTYGIIGKTVTIESCTIVVKSRQDSIGGSNCNSIEIRSSRIEASSDSGTSIGSTVSEPLDITIFNTTVAATASRDGGGIGNRQSNSGQLVIEKSKITAKSSGLSFSTIGFFKHINIIDSQVSSYALKGLCAIGGGSLESLECETTITIEKSIVTGYSSGDSAAIGGTKWMTSTVVITDSTVRATNSNVNGPLGSAIGGSENSYVKLIQINHSNVTCLTNGNGAPIGSGGGSGSFALIQITSGSIVSCENRGSELSSTAGIGGFNGGKIEVSDSLVKSIGGDEGAGIGGGPGGFIDSIHVIRSEVNASSKGKGAAIGSGSSGFVKDGIFIAESNISAFAGVQNHFAHGASIGGGYKSSGGYISIIKSNITAAHLSPSSAAAIGGGLLGAAGSIHITDSFVHARASTNATESAWEASAGAGIGCGGSPPDASSTSSCSGSVRISSSVVVAKGGSVLSPTAKKTPIAAGSGIGFGGTTVYTAGTFLPFNVTIKNGSSVFAYGGNATGQGGIASPAVSASSLLVVEDSLVRALSGYNSDRQDEVNWNFGLAGHFIVRGESTVVADHLPDDSASVPVRMDDFAVDGSRAQIEMHSTRLSALGGAHLHAEDAFVVVLSNVDDFKDSTIKFHRKSEALKSEIIQRSVRILPTDKEVVVALPTAGVYSLSVIKDDVENEIINADGKPFEIHHGFNHFANFFIKEKSTESATIIQTIEMPSKSEIYEDEGEIEDGKVKGKSVVLIVGISIGAIVAVGIIILIIVVVVKKKKARGQKKDISAGFREKLMENQPDQL